MVFRMCWNLFRIKDYRNGKLETGAIFILPAYLDSIQALVVPIVDWTKGKHPKGVHKNMGIWYEGVMLVAFSGSQFHEKFKQYSVLKKSGSANKVDRTCPVTLQWYEVIPVIPSKAPWITRLISIKYYPLVNKQFAIENGHLVRWFTH